MTLFILISCSARQEYASHEWIPETEPQEFFQEGLLSPRGFLPHEDGFVVADADSILFITGTDTHTLISNINTPDELVPFHENEIFYSTTTGIGTINLNSNSFTTLHETASTPTAITFHNEILYWIVEGMVFSDEQLDPICTDIETAYDLHFWNDILWISDQNSKSLWTFDGFDCSLAHTLDTIPHKITSNDESLWVTTRSSRWPYGGWILALQNGSLNKRTQSPPEPEDIIIWQDTVFWSSKQSITSFVQEPYEMEALQARVSHMLIHENILYWSDPQGGRIGLLELE